MIIKNNNISKKVTFLLFSIFFLIGTITFKDYGMAIDEEWQRASGFYWLNYILNFTPFENFKIAVNEAISQIGGFTLPSIEGNKSYGVIFDLPVAFLEVFFQIEDPKNYDQKTSGKRWKDESVNTLMEKFSDSISFDRRIYAYDIE